MTERRHSRHRRFDLLTPDEETELARRLAEGRAAAERIDQGDGTTADRRVVADAEAARRRFVEANLRLVYRMANRTASGPNIDRDDVVQDGMVGLQIAVDRFDGTLGYRFSTYATWWIRHAIQRGLEHHATTIRIPSHRRTELWMARANAEADAEPLSADLERLASLERLDSLDRTVGDGADTLGDLLEAGADGPDEAVLHQLDRDAVERILGELDPTTRQAVRRRFGLDGDAPATYSAIAEDLGVSDEAARRRVIRALTSLRPTAEYLAAA